MNRTTLEPTVTSKPQNVEPAELAKAILRLADIAQGMTERYGIYAHGKVRLGEPEFLYAAFDLDPVRYFTDENHSMGLWQTAWRQTRRDGARDQYKALHEAMREMLAERLPGDWRVGGLYTPDQIRDVAHQFTASKP